MIRIKQATKEGWIECHNGGVVDLSYPSSKTRRGRVQDNGDTCPTIEIGKDLYRVEESVEPSGKYNLTVRRLTPDELWLLMGLKTEDCDKARDVGVSNTSLKKEAGNGIVTNCVTLLAEHLYKAQYDNDYVCADEKMTKLS